MGNIWGNSGNSVRLEDGNDDPVCKTGKETQMCIMDFWTQREGESGMIWENDILTCILSCKN